ncbi:MAG: TolC family protein [Chitinophagaceae bacterium]|nr:TolC family protein [Chitinophagaceae bacterium]
MNYCKFKLTVLSSLFFIHGISQDSLRISIKDADKLFVEKNLMFAAAQLNVDAQKAMEIQARLYPNPEFSAGIHAYDAETKKVFYAGQNGEKTFDFNQLILLGGKRKNQIKLSEASSKQAAYQLETLMRNLKYELHTNLYSLHFDLRTLGKYNTQLAQLDTIIDTYEVQAKKGNIPLKEVVRLKSTYIRLNNDKTDLLQSIQQSQKDLQVILHTGQYIFPVIDSEQIKKFEQLLPIDSLQTLAYKNRDDLKASNGIRTIADLNYKYQKSLAVPDLNLGTSYDQMGGAFNHQFLLTLGIPLPLWNRNQGNIKYAETQQKIADVNLQLQQQVIESEVNEAWANMFRSIQEFQKIQQVYNAEFANVYAGMQTNFLKRNISIVEFVDFFEAYNETVAEVYRIRKQLMVSAENINYAVAYPIYSIN